MTDDRSTNDLLREACTGLGELLASLGHLEYRNGQACAGLMTVDHLIADPDRLPSERYASGLKSRIPGNVPVFNAIMDAHATVRDVEASLRYAVAGRTGSPRGGSDGNTRRALEVIPKLGAGATDRDRRQATRKLNSAAGSIERLVVIDTAIVWQPLRRAPDGRPPRCERCAPATGVIRCVFPACPGDLDGNPVQGRLDVSRVDGTPCITWRDGTVSYAYAPAVP